MKLRYYADSSFEDDHRGVLDRLRSISDTWDLPVEICRVRKRHGEIENFPGYIEADSIEDAYERDFKYNETLSSNMGHAPSDAFETKGGLITIAGSVGVVVAGDLQWATMLSGTPPDTHSGTAHTYSISFLDDVLDRGPTALEEKTDTGGGTDWVDPGGGTDTISEFVEADAGGIEDVDDAAIRRDVTVGASTAITTGMSDGARQVARDVATRTVDAIIEGEDHWVIEEKREFTSETFDAAIGEILLADALYRADEGLLEADTRRAVIFGEFPGGIDLTDQPEMLSFIVGYAKSLEIDLFVGVDPDQVGAGGREFIHLTARPELVM